MSETFLPGPAVRDRYKISTATLFRWQRNPSMNFPAPIRANSVHLLWRLSDLEAWEQSRIDGGADASAA
jgi:predicted DNA-binding transcriptional regulator AlpA